MGGTKGVIDVDIAELGELLAEFGDAGLVGLNLAAVLVLNGALLLNVETQVLKENDGTFWSRDDSFLHLRSDRVV
ncbi:hypothetical protein CVT25_015524 [Psilocybe cyanescens]|uniref:Uncharacterized protein n=1 Tax=Psilocybe cyanescens TaxID=93625 RepID=A0A409WI93_PSICY|nr:hypothetical protein CVT25_015524 [Psilocybe cyanescens]